MPLTLFCSYSRKDKALRIELETHLKPLQREGLIATWHDQMLIPGEQWNGRIREELKRADIVLFLLSPSFIASDYIMEVEVACALERHRDGHTIVIPVILRTCQWEYTPFANLQGLPSDMQPVTKWGSFPHDDGFDDVARGIRKVVMGHSAGKAASPNPSAGTASGPAEANPVQPTDLPDRDAGRPAPPSPPVGSANGQAEVNLVQPTALPECNAGGPASPIPSAGTVSGPAELNFVPPSALPGSDAGSPASPSPSAGTASGPAEWKLVHPYTLPEHFTGRAKERAMLTEWLERDAAHPVFVLRALAGFGKSALTWKWLTADVCPEKWPRVLWWSFYETGATFDAFVKETLVYLGVAPPESADERTRLLLRVLKTMPTLLVLDGFERELHAFAGLEGPYKGDGSEPERSSHETDCISPHATLFLQSLAVLPDVASRVLITTRLMPKPLKPKGGVLTGCRERELDALSADDAVAYFRSKGIKGRRAEIEEASRHYDFHPLSLCLLAGVILSDPKQPGDIAVAPRLHVTGDLIQRKHHVLEVAWERLPDSARKVLGRIACFRGPVTYDVLEALAKEDGAATLEADVRLLVERGLLYRDSDGRLDLHPIIRGYAYERLTDGDRTATHSRLRDHFAAVPKAKKVTRIEDLEPVIELYHHTVRAGEYDAAFEPYRDRVSMAAYYQLGAYRLIVDLMLALFPDGEDRPPRLKGDSAQGWALIGLATACSLSGQPRRAVPLFERANASDEARGDKGSLAIGLGSIANSAQFAIGAFRTADGNLRRAIALSKEIRNARLAAIGHRELGCLLALRGRLEDADGESATALSLFEAQLAVQSHGIVWASRSLRFLIAARHSALDGHAPQATTSRADALSAACRALELAEETARTRFPHERDFIRAHWLIGASQVVAGDHAAAEPHLTEALERCRRISLISQEGDILIDLARLRRATGRADEARAYADEAVEIADRCGYVLVGADARIELARLARDRKDVAAARAFATEALRLATCDGYPDWCYLAAYKEAEALLAELK